MPKKKYLEPDRIIDAIIAAKSEIVSENGFIQPPSNLVWFRIAQILEGKYNPKSIYILVKTNKYNLLEKLGLRKEDDNQNNLSTVIETYDETTKDEITIDAELKSSDSSSISSNKSESPELKFTITLTPSEWDEIRPNDVWYKCSDGKRSSRKYKIFSPNRWTPIIAENFYLHTKLTCCLSFKRAKIYESGECYAISKATCSDCGSRLSVTIENEPKENSKVLLLCTYIGEYLNCHTNMKRRQIGRIRDMSVAALKYTNVTANEFRKEQARLRMNFNDKEPSDLPSSNALRVLKSRVIAESRSFKDPISSIHAMRYANTDGKAIRAIGLDPFYVFYWLPTQIYVFREYAKSPESKISIDATGGVVKKIKRPQGNKSSTIFLYEVTVHDTGTGQQYSVSNMLSEKHDTNIISYWLSEWKKDVGESPKEIIMDHSMALLSASAKAFTSVFDIYSYIDICFKAIFHFTDTVILPKCFLRTDVAHTMKLICSWNVFKNVTKRSKLFYVCALAQIMMSTNITEIKDLFENIFTVALSETEGRDMNTGQFTHCELAKSTIKRRIAVGTGSEVEKLVLNNIDDIYEMQEDHDRPTGFSSWVQDLANKSKLLVEEEEGDHDNSQYLPHIVDLCVNLSKKLPLWTAIMVPLFEYGSTTASSASVESSFNNLKKRVFSEKKLPIRADDFLSIHIKSLEGSMIISAAKKVDNRKGKQHTAEEDLVKKKTVSITQSIVSDFDKTTLRENFESHIEDTENWRGEALPLKKRPRKSYLNTHPELLNADMSSKKSLAIGILKNGNRYTELKSLTINNKKYVLSNTCAFDSICQVVAAAVSDSEIYKRHFELEKENSFNKLILDISKNISSKSYKLRGELLLMISNVVELPSKVLKIACQNTAKTVTDHFFKEIPSVVENYNCRVSEHNKTVKRALISIAVYPHDISNLIQYIDAYLLEVEMNCNFSNEDSICTEKVLRSFVLQKTHIIIELVNSDVPEDDVAETEISTFEVSLDSIPRKLYLQQTEYWLRGIICFTPPDIVDKITDIGHYRAICLRSDDQWELYDDMKDKKIPISNQSIFNCEILVYTI